MALKLSTRRFYTQIAQKQQACVGALSIKQALAFFIQSLLDAR
jgi:hypothetical protein